MKLKTLEKRVSQLQEQEKSLLSQFLERVGDSNKFKEFLLKASFPPLPPPDEWAVFAGVSEEDKEGEGQGGEGSEGGRGGGGQ